MAEGQEDLLQELIQAYQETLRILRSFQSAGRSLLSRLSHAQQKRALIERGNQELRWNENLRQATQDMSPDERSQLLERHADVVLDQNGALEAQANDLLARNQDLEQQNAAGEDRLAEQQRLLDAERNDDRNRDGFNDGDVNDVAQENAVDDRVQENTVDDTAQDEALDDAAADRERAEAEAAEAEQKRKEQQEEANRRNERGDGLDPAAAAETAAAAGLAAGELEELQEDRAEDLQQAQGLDENGERLDPANEADNELETGTDDAERGQVDPAAEAGLDADDRQHQDELGQGDPSQDQPGPGDQGQEPGLDADNELSEPGVDANNALDDRSRDADNALEADVSQEGPSPYAKDESDRDSPTVDAAGPALDSDVNRDDGQQTDVSADRDGVNPAVAADDRGTDELREDQSDLGQDPPQAEPADVDSQQVDGQQPAGQQVSPQQVDAPGAEAPGAEGPQAEAPQVDAPQAPEQGANQVPQVNGPDTQQIANASQTAVDEAGLDGDGQGAGAQTSEAQGSQWRPPEDPAIAEARASQPNGQQSGPSQDLPPGEKAQIDNIRGDQKPLSSVKVDSGGVATSERPGTPAAQRDQNLNRGGRGQGDDGGRGRGDG